jgi:hypothetical protein
MCEASVAEDRAAETVDRIVLITPRPRRSRTSCLSGTPETVMISKIGGSLHRTSSAM